MFGFADQADRVELALVGVVLPFGLGYWVAEVFGLTDLQALVLGAALTATSVGITARVLSDLGRLQDAESQVILGAAVLDDIVGLIILAVVTTLVAGGDHQARRMERWQRRRNASGGCRARDISSRLRSRLCHCPSARHRPG